MFIATIVIYCVGLAAWLLAGFGMMMEDCNNSRAWKIWRACLPVGLLTLWAWWTIVPLVIIWGLFKFSKDAWELFRGRKNDVS